MYTIVQHSHRLGALVSITYTIERSATGIYPSYESAFAYLSRIIDRKVSK